MSGGIRGVEKASILMMSLNEDVATKIFAMMTEDEIKQISQCMSGLGKVDTQQVENLVSEFSDEISAGKSLVGDANSAKKLLTKALGAEKVDSIMGDMSGGGGGKDTWEKMNNVEDEVLATFLKNEYPQTAAVILSKLRTAKAAKLLSILPDEIATEVMRRMITLEPVKREILADLEKTLQAEFMSSAPKAKKVDSFESIAEIFNNFDRNTEGRFFELMNKKDPTFSEKVKSLMFTFDDLVKVPAAGIQAIIRSADKAKLPLALKGANEEIKTLFFSNMSERASKLLKEEITGLGPVRISQVDEAQMSIVQTTKQLMESGEVVIPDPNAVQEQMIE